MKGQKRRAVLADETIDQDTWHHRPAKLPKASAINLGEIQNLLSFDGKRKPISRSSVSQKVFPTYRTAANDWHPKTNRERRLLAGA